MIRLAPLLAAAAIALFVARSSYAVGAVLLTPGDAVEVLDVRYAIALSSGRTTRWASLRVERFPGAMAWVLPVRPGAQVEEVGDAWFDALELATAPRIVGAACGDGGAPPQLVTESRPPLGPSVRSLRRAVLDDVPALRAFAKDWGFDLPPEMDARFGQITARGFALLALVYGGPAEGNATRTVRIADDAFPWVPLALTAGHDDPVPVTTFVFADARVRLGSDTEIDLEGARIAMTQEGTTNYATELRSALVAARGTRWAAEAAGHDVLFDGARGPAGVDPIPALAPTYFRLAGADDHTDASDLPVALSGLDPNAVWVTRLSGIVPSGGFGDDLAVTRRDEQHKSPFIVATGSKLVCPVADGGRVGPEGGPGGTIPPPPSPPSGPRQPPGTVEPPGTTPPGTIPPDQPTVSSVEMSCSCSPGPEAPEPAATEDSCDGSDPGHASDSDESCEGSADDPADESCDASSDSSQGSGDDSCDGSSSSDSGSDDGCSSDSPDGSDGCSSDSRAPAEGCSTAPRARAARAKSAAGCSTRARRSKTSRPRVSAITFAVAAVALVMRRRRRRQRSACTGANSGFGQ